MKNKRKKAISEVIANFDWIQAQTAILHLNMTWKGEVPSILTMKKCARLLFEQAYVAMELTQAPSGAMDAGGLQATVSDDGYLGLQFVVCESVLNMDQPKKKGKK